jgi:hypothetical protein
MMADMKISLISIVLLVLVVLGASACVSAPHAEIPMLDAALLPPVVQSAPERVLTAYQFAAANPQALEDVPCFCGCGAIGHMNNRDCYLKPASGANRLVFDEHALGCQICVDITLDVMEMTRAGRSAEQIQRAIINRYSQFGPSNLH